MDFAPGNDIGSGVEPLLGAVSNGLSRRDEGSSSNSESDDDDAYYGYDNYSGSGSTAHIASGYSGSGSALQCLTNQEAYLGDGCCAGTCATSLNACYDCPEKKKNRKENVGGPSCFREGACIAEEPQGLCPAPARKRVRGTGTEYAGWCVCPGGSFCQGDGCTTNATTATGAALNPRDRWDPDKVSRCPGVSSPM